MAKRTYSDTERATALVMLDANGGNLSRTQRETGVPRSTLREWRDGRHHSEVADIRQEKKEDLADLWERLARNIFEYGITTEKIKAAPLKDLVVAAGIATDKMLALRGGPTERTEQIERRQSLSAYVLSLAKNGQG